MRTSPAACGSVLRKLAILLIYGSAQRVLSEKDGLAVGAILAVSVGGASTWIAGFE
jgi:asparagine N-glycosylation enzyme membrane subunit Stt3